MTLLLGSHFSMYLALIQKGKWLEEGQMVVLASETMLPIISVSPKVGNSASFWNVPLYPVTTPPTPIPSLTYIMHSQRKLSKISAKSCKKVFKLYFNPRKGDSKGLLFILFQQHVQFPHHTRKCTKVLHEKKKKKRKKLSFM